MTINEMIIKLMKIKQETGGQLPIHMLYLNPELGETSKDVKVKKNVKIGIGYEEKTNNIKCLLIMEESHLRWLEPRTKLVLDS